MLSETVYICVCVCCGPSDPAFVGSAHITGQDSERSDDQIYFFFSEMGKEFDFFDNTIVSRIARVCKVRQIV